MNEKFYNEHYVSDQTTHCFKQRLNDTQLYYSYSNFPLNNSSFTENHSSNSISVQEPSDILTWENRILPEVDKLFKLSEKIDMVEIPSKNLSPVSYCSNIEPVIPDSYKQNSSNAHNFNRFDNEWRYSPNSCNQKSSTFYASCAQDRFYKYNNMQKNQYLEFTTRNCNYNTFQESSNKTGGTDNTYISNEASDYLYNCYENKINRNEPFLQHASYFITNVDKSFAPTIKSIDEQTECSNEESDIIVEDSEEEITDFGEDHEKGVVHRCNKCLVCNIIYQPHGTQFYFLTMKNPLTMSSQKPVVQTLISIVGNISTTNNYLCNNCLGLINSIDHLEIKLKKLKFDLVTRFEKNLENKTNEKKSCPKKTRYFSKYPKYKCKLCSKVLCLKEYCFYHLKQHRNPGYLCDLCGKIFSNKKKFSLHCMRHKKILNTKIDSFKCSHCPKIFRTKSNQKEHENYCLGVLPFKCNYQHCNKKFPSATKLKNHVKFKHDKKFIVICSICNIGFIKASDYKNHMVSHSTDKKYLCTKCNKTYKTLSNLNFHMKIHSGSLPFNCHICSKGFMRKEYLEAHINNHSGIKNFNCTACEKKFVSQKNLDAHLKYHEGTVKKNTCNICGKIMTTGFGEHLRIHNNVKDFECEQCNMRFNTKGAFSKHVKKKHVK